MVFGLGPGYVARTTIVGGTTSGYSLIGNRTIAIRPTMKMMIESTPAKIGRRMKKWEKFIIFSWLVRRFQEAQSPKLKVPKKPESPNSKRGTARQDCFGFGVWSFFGAWSLELFHSGPLL